MRIAWGLTQTALTIINPPPPPKADYRYKSLPGLKLPASNSLVKVVPDASYSYKLQTEDGESLPKFQDVIKIPLKPIQTSATFDSESKMQTIANTFEFKEKAKPPANPKDTRFTWQDATQPFRSLEADILTRNFVFKYDVGRDTTYTANKSQLPSIDEAVKEGTEILKKRDLFKKDLDENKAKASYWKISAGTFVPVSSFSEADVTRVDFFRKDADNIPANYPLYKARKTLPFFYPDPNRGLIYMYISGNSDANKRIAEMSYTYWPIDTENAGLYPLIPVQDAFNMVKSAKSYIASYNPKKPAREIVITDVQLGYFESESQDEFLYPVYVFKGEDDFVAYVPASINEEPAKPKKN